MLRLIGSCGGMENVGNMVSRQDKSTKHKMVVTWALKTSREKKDSRKAWLVAVLELLLLGREISEDGVVRFASSFSGRLENPAEWPHKSTWISHLHVTELWP